MCGDRQMVAQVVGFVQVMGRQKDGGACPAQCTHLIAEAGAALGIKASAGSSRKSNPGQ